MRAAKLKVLSREVKKVFLANSTLVVVPAILIQQWKDEIETHIEAGTLKVLEVTKGPLPNIEELLQYDVSLFPPRITFLEPWT